MGLLGSKEAVRILVVLALMKVVIDLHLHLLARCINAKLAQIFTNNLNDIVMQGAWNRTILRTKFFLPKEGRCYLYPHFTDTESSGLDISIL